MTMLGGLKPVFLEALRFADAKTRAALVEQWNKECQAIYEYKKQLIVEEHYKAAHNGSGWISVEERLPEPQKLVLCIWERVNDGWHYGFARYQREDVWYVSNEGMPRVTHWMPLPEAPKGGVE